MNRLDYSCRTCGAKNDAVKAVDDLDSPPEPGAVLICVYCASVSVFAEDLTPREPTADEMEELVEDPNFLSTMVRLQKVLYTKAQGRPTMQN